MENCRGTSQPEASVLKLRICVYPNPLRQRGILGNNSPDAKSLSLTDVSGWDRLKDATSRSGSQDAVTKIPRAGISTEVRPLLHGEPSTALHGPAAWWLRKKAFAMMSGCHACQSALSESFGCGYADLLVPRFS